MMATRTPVKLNTLHLLKTAFNKTCLEVYADLIFGVFYEKVQLNVVIVSNSWIRYSYILISFN